MIYEKLRILSEEAIAHIHQTTLRVFSEIGLQVMSERGCRLWADWGARWDEKTGRVYIPEQLVSKALESAPSQILCGARAPENSFTIGDGTVHGRNGGGPGQITDLESGELRNATRQDTADYARLVDALKNTHIAAPLYEQESVPHVRDLSTLLCILQNTGKHINFRLLEPGSLPYFIRMAELMAGGKQALKAAPPITLLESPIAPLKHPDVLVDAVLACGEAGIPIEICSMPIAGATGPITLAGSLLMSNVEMLAAVVFGQLAHPGMPMIFAPRIMVMDMASGYALTGSMENALLVTAGAQLAKEAYHMPVNMHGPYTDSLLNDCQAGVENTYFSLLPALAGADILTGAGHLQGGLVVNFTQLVLDDEIVGTVNRAIEGLTVDEETLGFEAVAASIETDNLLMHPHTMRHLRADRYRPQLMTRMARATWEEKGSQSMRDRAVEKVRHILNNHTPPPLAEDVQSGMQAILQEAEHRLAAP